MRVVVDKKAGFCFGVANATKIAETVLEEGSELYCLGELVHNQQEMQRLSSMGIKIIDKEQFHSLHDSKVLIRAHGEPPETYIRAEKNNIRIIDATCPIVRHLQRNINNRYEWAQQQGGQIVIFGKLNHPEVIGLIGHTDRNAIVVSGPDDIQKIDPKADVYLYAQTTMSPESYQMIANLIADHLRPEHGKETPKLYMHNTVCNQVTQRIDHLRQFASKYDVILFISGKNSSNGRFLYGVCQSVNPQSYLVSCPQEVDHLWLQNAVSVGVTGATSTPVGQLQQIADSLKKKAE